jgi:hypothetical protein
LHGRGAGYDSESSILGQGRDEFIGHAVGEVILVGVAGEVGERDYGQGVDLGGVGGGKEAGSQDDYESSGE